MLFLYMYHSRQRRARIEEQQGSLFLAVMCCLCVVFLEARSNKLGTRTHEERTARPSYQQNLYGARAMSFAWLMLLDLQIVLVVSSCLLELPCRGGLALPCS